MADSEIQRLCEQIYAKHGRAIDTILEYRPDRAQQIATVLRRLTTEFPDLVEDYSVKSYTRFTSKNLDRLPRLGAFNWTKSGRFVLFEITNPGNRVGLKLTLGPVRPGEEAARQRVHEMAIMRPDIFNKAREKFYPQFWTSYAEGWINKRSTKS